MSLTRKMLKAMGIEEDKIDQIIEAHTDVTDSLKADRDKYKADAEKVYDLERELEDAREKAANAAKDPYKEKYESEKQAFADYKKGVEAEQTKVKKRSAYKSILKETGVPERHWDKILKYTDLDSIELDEDGKVKDSDKIVDDLKKEWGDHIPKSEERGAGAENPPNGAGSGEKTLSRAAQVVAKRNEMIYGVKGDNK